MDNVQIRRKILKLLYDAQIENVSGAIAQEELARKIGVPVQDVQINLSYLADEDEKYAELSETVIGIRIYKFAKITIRGIKLFEDVSAFNRQFPPKFEQQKERIAYNLGALRALLTKAFDGNTLNYFCHDHDSFRPVYEKFTRGLTKDEMIQQLIVYVEAQDLFEELLTAVQEVNPHQYANYEAQLRYTTKVD